MQKEAYYIRKITRIRYSVAVGRHPHLPMIKYVGTSCTYRYTARTDLFSLCGSRQLRSGGPSFRTAPSAYSAITVSCHHTLLPGIDGDDAPDCTAA